MATTVRPHQKHIDAAYLLIEFFTQNADPLQLRDKLLAFVNTDFRQKTHDPQVYCSYGLASDSSPLYTADGVMLLSEYITDVVCERTFEYKGLCNTRMFGFSFKTSDVTMKIEETPGQHPRKGHFDINTTDYLEQCPYGMKVFYCVHKRLASHMESLPPLLPRDFLATRYDQLMAFAKNLLREECETNNPNVRLVEGDVEIRLSLYDYLALLKVNFTFEYPYKRDCILNIAKMTAEPTLLHTNTSCFLFNEDHKKALAMHGPSIQALLDGYEKTEPSKFFSLHFEEIKKKVGL